MNPIGVLAKQFQQEFAVRTGNHWELPDYGQFGIPLKVN
jgi:hypothetical protein